jgi:diacylglycerol O-acyltransferase
VTTRPLDPVDAAWFHMDGPVNTSVVTAMITARHAFDFEATRAVFADRLAPIERFRCRVVEHGLSFSSPCWEEMPDFDIDQHVHHRALPAGAGDADLMDLVSDLASQPLSQALPLWQVHVVDGPGQRGALVFRYHHCIGDGAAMVDIVRRVFDVGAGISARGPAPVTREATMGALLTPLLEAARSGIDAIGSLALDLLKSPDPVSPFKGTFVSRQRLACSAAIPLVRFRAIAEAFDAKINDVVVAAAAGALRQYLVEHGQPADPAGLRAMMPMNLRPPEHAHDGGNEFGLAIVSLPIELDEPGARLRAAKERLAALKHSSEAIGMRWLLDAFGRGPKPLQQVAQRLFGSKVSLVLTNVAGPARPLSLAARRIDRMMFWVPHPGEDVGLGISVFSYRGKVSLGVIGDALRLPDPQRIAHLFEREIAELQRHAVPAAPTHGVRTTNPRHAASRAPRSANAAGSRRRAARPGRAPPSTRTPPGAAPRRRRRERCRAPRPGSSAGDRAS